MSGYNPLELRQVSVHAEWWPEGTYVIIQERTWGQQQDLMGEVIGDIALDDFSGGDEDALMQKIISLPAMQKNTLLQSITEWNFVDADGEVLPINMHTISGLTQGDGQFLLEEVNKLNPQRDKRDED